MFEVPSLDLMPSFKTKVGFIDFVDVSPLPLSFFGSLAIPNKQD